MAIVNIIWMILMMTYYELLTFQRELSNNKFEIILSIQHLTLTNYCSQKAKCFFQFGRLKFTQVNIVYVYSVSLPTNL